MLLILLTSTISPVLLFISCFPSHHKTPKGVSNIKCFLISLSSLFCFSVSAFCFDFSNLSAKVSEFWVFAINSSIISLLSSKFSIGMVVVACAIYPSFCINDAELLKSFIKWIISTISHFPANTVGTFTLSLNFLISFGTFKPKSTKLSKISLESENPVVFADLNLSIKTLTFFVNKAYVCSNKIKVLYSLSSSAKRFNNSSFSGAFSNCFKILLSFAPVFKISPLKLSFNPSTKSASSLIVFSSISQIVSGIFPVNQVL